MADSDTDTDITKDNASKPIEIDGEKWDRVYRDPTARIILLSDDGVLFRVSDWLLGQHSSVFKDLGALAVPQEERIETFMNAAAVRALVRFVHLPIGTNNTQEFAIIKFDEAMKLYTFLKKYDFADAMEIWYRVIPHHENREIDILRRASDWDDLDLAQATFSSLWPRLHKLGLWNVINALKPEWQAPFLKSIIDDGRHEVRATVPAFLALRAPNFDKIYTLERQGTNLPNPESDSDSDADPLPPRKRPRTLANTETWVNKRT